MKPSPYHLRHAKLKNEPARQRCIKSEVEAIHRHDTTSQDYSSDSPSTSEGDGPIPQRARHTATGSPSTSVVGEHLGAILLSVKIRPRRILTTFPMPLPAPPAPLAPRHSGKLLLTRPNNENGVGSQDKTTNQKSKSSDFSSPTIVHPGLTFFQSTNPTSPLAQGN